MKGCIVENILPHDLMKVCNRVYAKGDRMQMAYAYYPIDSSVPELAYLASIGPKQPFQLFRCPLNSKEMLVPSLAIPAPLLGWYEREISDLFGIHFSDHPENYPLVLQEGVKTNTLPFDPNYPPDKLLPFARAPWTSLAIHEHGMKKIQQVPYGPVCAGVVESLQNTYFYAGELILHLYQRLFFKHRGIEKRFEGLEAEQGAVLAERVSGVSSVAHALAFCQAVETASDCEITYYAKQWRVILAELERLYNHLHYLGHLCHTTTLKVGEMQGLLLEERVKQLNAKVTGSRFLREILTPGGLRREPNSEPIKKELSILRKDITTYCHELCNTNTHIDRLMKTGILTTEVAFDEGATGPITRASGIARDFRCDYPYAAYDNSFTVPCLEKGDAYARMLIRIQEIQISLDLIKKNVDDLAKESIRVECNMLPNSSGLGWAESSRGGLFYALHINADRKFSRVKIKSPSFSNWRVFPFTVHNSNMMDYAINEASFGLTVAGCDR